MRTSLLGLRAQFLIGLALLLVASFALGAVVVEDVMTRRLMSARAERLDDVLAVLGDLGPESRARLVELGTIDAIWDGQTGLGDEHLITRLRDTPRDRYVMVAERKYLVRSDRATAIAANVDDIRADVAAARATIFLFASLAAVVLAALGYAFFGFLVVRPVRAIGVAAERAAHGDLASPVAVVPRNEIGHVARSFNEMLRQLDANREALEHKLHELERANAELAATRDSLVRSEKLASVGQLAAGIAHEIGNPLAAVSGYNELLQDGGLDEDDVQDVLRRSGEQLERIRGVIRNLLDFSRDESGAPPGATDLGQCMREAASLVQATARTRAVRVDVADPEGRPARAVPSQVVQILVNLALNAADAIGDRGGTVRISRADDAESTCIRVDDDGPGVPPEVAHRIFDPFFTTKDPGEGTGLGLAISARIAESLGGSLQVGTSDLGGARFDLRLPYDEDPLG